ncbi:discoidin domain-containing protein [Actinospica sp.]|uniref:discoidin domain-containing protein n=1 Tax=Actinospica sp. TaxID=1872142 RepID=UPI002C1AEA6E|nr:discoidin domain-containing protein [Actinospica sp.]HWG25015.1 discoidin domain-containing protein [Actinospica sp.]
MTRKRRLVGATTRRAVHYFVAAATACGLVSLAPVLAASPASAATQTQLSETGWTASSNTNSAAGDAPQNAISASGARFSSDAAQASGMWWQVNMGSAQSFDQIEMDSGGYPGDYARGYEVEISSDGTNFTTVYTGTGTSSPETATFATQTAQYIRVQLTTGVSPNWWSMVNFTAYTSGSGSSGGGGTNGQLTETGWAATSNTNSAAGDAPQNAINASGARFSSDADQAPGMWWQADMGSVQTFNQVNLDSGTGSGDYARGYDVEVSNDGTKFTPVYFGTGTASPETATFSTQQARYIRILLTASSTTSWWSLTNVTVFNTSTSATLPGAPATGGSLGANVYVFTPSESVSSILSTVNTISNAQAGNQFGSQRYELLFEPGTYGSASTPLVFSVGFYESVAGLGQNPGQVVINGAINSYNQCTNGVQTECYATTNFWRSVSNLTINVTGMTGCFNGTDVWAVSQAAPMRRVNINGNLTLMDYCDGSPDWASGGFIADSKLNNTVTNGSQQQFFVRNTDIGSWSNGVWNQVFCGDPGAPPQSFSGNSGLSGGTAPYTTLGSCPTTQEEPYLYTDSSGNYNVFVPSAQSNSNGPTWANGNTPGSSLSLNSFYVVNSSSTIGQINAALAAGDNLLFTPGVYQYAQTIQVTHANTKILGLGFATLIPTSGNVTMSVADVPGVNVSGLIFDAGPTQSSALLQLGTEGSTANNAANPDSVDDVFFRVGGEEAGTVATAFVDNSNDSLIDDVWSWRADHGAGAGGWTGDQSATGLAVNGDRVEANGLAVEHYQQYETIWNGQGGKVVFFQNENPYEVPSQAAWMSSATQNGYPAFYVPNSVTTFNGYGMGSYSYFSQGVAIENAMAFQAPQTSGVQFNDLLTVFLNGTGGIQTVIDGTGAAVSPSFGGPSDVVTFN